VVNDTLYLPDGFGRRNPAVAFARRKMRAERIDCMFADGKACEIMNERFRRLLCKERDLNSTYALTKGIQRLCTDDVTSAYTWGTAGVKQSFSAMPNCAVLAR
jgi:hypothetical protein